MAQNLAFWRFGAYFTAFCAFWRFGWAWEVCVLAFWRFDEDHPKRTVGADYYFNFLCESQPCGVQVVLQKVGQRNRQGP